MQRNLRFVTTLCLFILGLKPVNAQTTSASSSLVAQPISDRAVSFSVSAPGVSKPMIWGMDAGGWTNPTIWRTGVSFLNAENIKLTRIPAFPTDTLYGDTLQQSQKNALNDRLSQVGLAGHPLQIMLNPGGGEISWYSRDSIGYARYALLMELTKNYIQSFGHTVVSITGYNEPDYGPNGVTQQNFYDFITACKRRPGLSSLRFCGGNTLNDDLALSWYNYVKPAGLTEGNTHQLAGSFDSYANFFQTVKANGHYATSDEVHDIMEGMVGAEYGMQAGIYWGYANLARGEFVKASTSGVRLGYAEHRPNWTAAAVYRNAQGKVQAFGGASERQATTTTFSFVSKDKDVYYDGNGPMREYSLVMPGGTGYQTNQPYAERVLNITYGEDIQPAINGRYVLVNRSGKVMEVPGGSITAGTFLQQNTYSGATYQQWNVTPVDSRIGGDFSYFTIANVNSGKAIDIYNWSLDNGGSIDAWDDTKSANQQWYFDYAGDGWFYIRSRHNAKCVEVSAGGINIDQWEVNGSAGQQWRLLPIDAAIEFVAPGAPGGLVATAQTESVKLTWTASTATDLAGYSIFRADTAGGAYNTIARKVTTTSFVDNTATSGGTYYYKIKAVDKSQNRSAYSSEVSATPTGTKDLVAYYPFNGNTLDTSINLNHGAALVTPSYVTGKVGSGALTLNGTTNFVKLPATIANHQAITVAAWVYWSGGGAWQRIFDFGNDQSQYLFLTPSSGSGTLRFAIKNGGAEQILDAPALPLNQWSHVAVTLGATGARLYVNGLVVAQSSAMTIRPMDFKPVLNYIGRSQYPDPLLNGSIDEFKIYNYALSAIEVANLGSSVVYYQLRNRTTGLFLDGMGRWGYGDNCGQWANTTSYNSHWALLDAGNGYYQLQNRTTGLFLDGMGRTANGDSCGQWGNTTHPNSHWLIVPFDSLFYRLQNRSTGMYLDGMGRTANGSNVGQWANTTNTNAQWQFLSTASNQVISQAKDSSAVELNQGSRKVLIYPNPAVKVLTVRLANNERNSQARIFNVSGQLMKSIPLNRLENKVEVDRLPSGMYIVEVITGSEKFRSKFVKN